MEPLIITNNKRVKIEYSNRYEVEYYEKASQEDILKKARDYIHLGAKLIIHPMMGRIKPHETPFKSVFLEKRTGELDFLSLTIIEDSISETNKFLTNTYAIKYQEKDFDDLAYIDYLLIKSGIEEY